MFRRSHFLSLDKNLLLAIFVLFALLCLTFTLVFTTIIVPGFRLTNQFKVFYNVAATLVTTVLARYAAAEIRRQWLRYINHEISDARYQLHHNSTIGTQWRAILGINTLDEQIRNIHSTALAQISFIATGLITTAVVTAVTLQDTTCSAVVPAPRIHSGADNSCARSVPNTNVERVSPLWEYRTFWNRSDGSAYVATTNLGCPSWSGAQSIGSINTVNAGDFAYASNGVAVDNTAIGAPEILYTSYPNPLEPGDPLGHHIQQSTLQSVLQCLPIMSSNPIKCTPGGSITYTSNSAVAYQNVTIDAGGCSFSQSEYEDPRSAFGVMTSRLCTSNSTANATVGQGTIAIGATNIMSLTLAAATGDEDFLTQNGGKHDALYNGSISNLTYALSCTVDVSSSISWRTLTLNLSATTNSSSSYSKHVTAVDGCANIPAGTPSSAWDLGDGYSAGAVAALVPPLSEGRYWNGMINTILNQALNSTDTSARYSSVSAWQGLVRHGPFGFPASTNALEDVLGLTAGITMSQMTTLSSQSPGSPLFDSKQYFAPVPGTATFACTRIGPGKLFALIFCVPQLLALIIAIYLAWAVPLGRTVYKTSRLEDMVAVGAAGERELINAWRMDHEENLLCGAAPMGRWTPTPGPGALEDGEGGKEVPIGWNLGLWPAPAPEPEPGGIWWSRGEDRVCNISLQ